MSTRETSVASKGQRVGYVRVSSEDQNTARQLEGEELDRTFTDKASGKNRERPQLDACLKYLRAGDTLVVRSMDRLARNLMDMRHIVDEAVGKGAAVQFLKEQTTFTGATDPMKALMLNMMGSFAQFEREIIKERQREGIAIAKAAGKFKKERAKKLTHAQVAEAREMYNAGLPLAQLARERGVSRQTLYTHLRASASQWAGPLVGSRTSGNGA